MLRESEPRDKDGHLVYDSEGALIEPGYYIWLDATRSCDDHLIRVCEAGGEFWIELDGDGYFSRASECHPDRFNMLLRVERHSW